MESALVAMTDKGIQQPVLLRVQNKYFIKVDATAIPVPDCSCFVEAAEFLFMTFYVFAVHYPVDLKVFYMFFEHMLELKQTTKSSTLSRFLRELSGLSLS